MYFQLATPPRARFHVMMVVSMVRPQQFHNASEIMIPRRLCQASTGVRVDWCAIAPDGPILQARQVSAGKLVSRNGTFVRQGIFYRQVGLGFTAVDRKGRLYWLGEDGSHEKPKMDAPELKLFAPSAHYGMARQHNDRMPWCSSDGGLTQRSNSSSCTFTSVFASRYFTITGV
jgi:hypothetical protein